VKISRDIPMDHRVAGQDGRLTVHWLRWSEDVGRSMQKLSTEMAALEPLSGSATLSQVITAYNDLLAALKRVAP